MLTHRVASYCWLLVFLHITMTDSMKFNLFRKDPDMQPREGKVRLAGSSAINEGRVEIYHNGEWGTVCDDKWDLAEAQVVCRQLHFPGAKSAVLAGAYGEGPGPIWLDDMECKGTETSLSSCSFQGWQMTDCTHKEDAGVICDLGPDMNSSSTSDTSHLLDHSLSLSEELGLMFDSGKGCDFLITVQSPIGRQQEDGTMEMETTTTVCAHKTILSLFPQFNASEGSGISYVVRRSCQSYFTDFIRYIYTRKMDVTFSSAQCLHQMASDFGVTQLMEDTGRLFTRILPEDVTFHTQMSLYEYSVETGDLLLQENCLQYLAWNYQNLTMSPAWTRVTVDLLRALLLRSDLVVPDEAYVLRVLEDRISQEGNSTSLKSQADLLGLVRFPMIPAEKLYDLQFTSVLYNAHQDLYRDKILKALNFNFLLFSTLKNSSTFKGEDYDYQPRIYLADPWSVAINLPTVTNPPPTVRPREIYDSYGRRIGRDRYRNAYGGGSYGSYGGYQVMQPPTAASPYSNIRSKSFSTPVHNSLIFQNNMIQWDAGITRQPAATLSARRLYPYQDKVRFSNRLLRVCNGKYISQVQDFKNDVAQIASNSSQAVPFPCPNDEYIYHFVVRPEYI